MERRETEKGFRETNLGFRETTVEFREIRESVDKTPRKPDSKLEQKSTEKPIEPIERKLNDLKRWRIDGPLFITGIVFLGLSVYFFIVMGNNPKDAYGYTSGETIGLMIFALICLIIGFVTLSASYIEKQDEKQYTSS